MSIGSAPATSSSPESSREALHTDVGQSPRQRRGFARSRHTSIPPASGLMVGRTRARKHPPPARAATRSGRRRMVGGSGNEIADEDGHVGERLETRHRGDDPLCRLRGDRPRRRRAVAAEFPELGSSPRTSDVSRSEQKCRDPVTARHPTRMVWCRWKPRPSSTKTAPASRRPASRSRRSLPRPARGPRGRMRTGWAS